MCVTRGIHGLSLAHGKLKASLKYTQRQRVPNPSCELHIGLMGNRSASIPLWLLHSLLHYPRSKSREEWLCMHVRQVWFLRATTIPNHLMVKGINPVQPDPITVVFFARSLFSLFLFHKAFVPIKERKGMYVCVQPRSSTELRNAYRTHWYGFGSKQPRPVSLSPSPSLNAPKQNEEENQTICMHVCSGVKIF